jgi:hypothetical protein
MTTKAFIQAISIAGLAVLMLAASASATTITYNTNAAGTIFVGGGLVLNSSGGAAATLTYIPNVNSTTGVPSNINFGDFVLACPLCSIQGGGVSSTFGAFQFDLVINDVTDGATGMFVGTSTGGTIYSDTSQINITWLPLQLGPGLSGVLTGNFGTTIFTIYSPTPIVAPNSGTVGAQGDTTVQGHIDSTAIPEPATFSLIVAPLLGLCMLGRKRFFRR